MALSRGKKQALAVCTGLLAFLYLLSAAFLKVFEPERNSWILSILVGSEPFHIFAHTLLYGPLAVLAFYIFSSRVLAVIVVLLVGLAQESVQIHFCERGLSWPELFDLAVDVTAAILWLSALQYWKRKREGEKIATALSSRDF